MSSSSSTQSYTRFSDENYKNWLKTTESLYMLRSCIQDFIEKETETYHNSLRNKTYLKGQTCKRTCCDIKSACELCECWRKEIEANHNGKRNGIYWENCRPHLWSKEKWEVAKAHMPRGHKKHCNFAEFDVAAILNLMSSCKHFNIPVKYVTNVINVRNSAMHSPDLKISKEDMNRHHNTVLQLAKLLEPKIPKLKDLEKKITQFNNILDKNFIEAPCEVDGLQVDLQTMEVLNREQQALKDRIEDFIARFEGNQDENGEEKPEDMESLLDFLEQNKDLLENLGPEVDKLKEMQAKVDQHEVKITKLGDRVDYLEKVTLDPVIPGNPLRYKNNLYEYCQAKKWPEDKFPVFTEILEAHGYRAEVKVNGQSFSGQRVFNDKKSAHQDVAYIALEQLKSQEESTDEPSSSVTQPEASCSSSSGITFFGKVTVDLDQEVASDRCASVEEATEAAYKVLWERFRISAPAEGRTYRSLIMEHFNTQRFQKPTEHFVQNDDDTTICKLKLVGPFTFYDKDGATRKRLAEEQAAKVALQHLSGILNYVISGTEEKFKSVLNVRLQTLHLNPAVYETREYKEEISDDHVTSGITLDQATSAVSIGQAAEKEHLKLKPESISTSGQESVRDPVPVLPDPQESSSPAAQKKKPRIDCPGTQIQDEKTPNVKVKQVFSQNSLPLPQDDVEESAPPFYCSLKNISYKVIYTGQGSTEDEAKSDALQTALCSLSPLFDYASITVADSAEDVQNQLSFMLKGAGQKDPVISLKPVEQACIQLSFCDYTVKCACQNTKKAARNHLSARILGLLGVETGANDASLRSRLNEWFSQQHLPQPVFKDTEEVLGQKATFSVPLTCYSPDWEDSWETAKTKLLQVLKERFIFLNDKNN